MGDQETVVCGSERDLPSVYALSHTGRSAGGVRPDDAGTDAAGGTARGPVSVDGLSKAATKEQN